MTDRPSIVVGVAVDALPVNPETVHGSHVRELKDVKSSLKLLACPRQGSASRTKESTVQATTWTLFEGIGPSLSDRESGQVFMA
jgi:hypothetical protein